MIPSIDYMTLVLSGTVLFYVGVEGDDPAPFEIVVAAVGAFLFIVGAGRAFMSAFGL